MDLLAACKVLCRCLGLWVGCGFLIVGCGGGVVVVVGIRLWRLLMELVVGFVEVVA